MVATKEGKLMWVIDGYTTTDAYPYSAQVPGMGNYIRNSVKAVIDAYNGSLSLYIADSEDPIIATYARIFPQRLQAAFGHAGRFAFASSLSADFYLPSRPRSMRFIT